MGSDSEPAPDRALPLCGHLNLSERRVRSESGRRHAAALALAGRLTRKELSSWCFKDAGGPGPSHRRPGLGLMRAAVPVAWPCGGGRSEPEPY